MKNLLPAYLLTSLLLLSALPAAAEGPEPGQGRGWRGGHHDGPGSPPPFGDYCPRRHADHYGARQPVSSVDEAIDRLARFYRIPPERVQPHKERRNGFIIDILNPDGSPADRVIIDKWSGRIRSTR